MVLILIAYIGDLYAHVISAETLQVWPDQDRDEEDESKKDCQISKILLA